MPTTAEKEWEREQKRRREQAGESEAARLNTGIARRIETLERLLEWSLRHPIGVEFEAMKVPIPQFLPSPTLSSPLPQPNPDTFKPRPLNPLTKMIPGAEERFQKRWERGRVAYEQAHTQWQQAEDRRREQFARSKKEHELAVAAAREQHRRVDELKADFRTGRRAAVEQCLTMALQASRYPNAFPHKFALIYRRRDQELLIEYEFPLARDIPDEASFRYVKIKERVEAKPRTTADKQKLYKSVLAQITLRVSHELLTADLHEHVQRIAFNGVVEDIDPSTGRPTRPKLVSLRVGRAEFLDRDFSRIEPQSALRSLKANFSPAPTELRAVPPILEFDVNDPRFIDEEEILSSLDERTNLIDLTPQAFETVIRDLFQAMGFDTYQTTPSRDGGVDCVAHYTKSVVGGKYIIQAKRYTHRVPVEAVRDLAGALDHERASKGILVRGKDRHARKELIGRRTSIHRSRVSGDSCGEDLAPPAGRERL